MCLVCLWAQRHLFGCNGEYVLRRHQGGVACGTVLKGLLALNIVAGEKALENFEQGSDLARIEF